MSAARPVYPEARIQTGDKLKSRRKIYIILEEHDLVVDYDDVKEFDRLWEEGYSIVAIAKQLEMTLPVIGALVIDREFEGKIKPRSGGLRGDKDGSPEKRTSKRKGQANRKTPV
ncbi:hypothetical protein ACJ2A9_21455 [Anaerobacillus sp. MEB173]|uniref:hypothetical protein n=1 Tax=Anaerobacillus sp. MEB173 TaxID=3383345 RepID=UPI003F8F23F9